MQELYILLLAFFAAPAPGPGLTLAASHHKAKAGQTVCVDISVGDFSDIIGFQHTLSWDPAVLSLAGVRNFGLPGLGSDNFGRAHAEAGFLTFVWLDQSLNGVSLPDGAVIYGVCFTVKGKKGDKSAIRFTGRPTPVEVVDAREQVLPLRGVEGSVKVE